MNDRLADFERMGIWLAENEHDVVAVARCPRPDGRVVAKVCEVAGLRWTWFASLKVTKAAIIEDELEELRELPTHDGLPHPEEVDELIETIRRDGAPRIPPRAFPAEGDRDALVNCPTCRTRLRVAYTAGRFRVSAEPKNADMR